MIGGEHLVANLSPADARTVIAAASMREVPAGTTLFHQGDAPDFLLQVVSGLVKLSQITPEGVQTTLRIIGPEQLVGCVAVFQKMPYPATATTIGETTVLSWRAAQFFELMERYPVLVENSLRIVGNRAREMVERIVEMSGKGVEQRIAGALMRLAGQAGTPVDDGIRIQFPGSRKDLAEVASVTYFTISRTLSVWQRHGLVRTGRQRVTILAPQVLARIAQGHDSGLGKPAARRKAGSGGS